MEIIALIITALLIEGIIGNEIIYKKQKKLCKAAYLYGMCCIESGKGYDASLIDNIKSWNILHCFCPWCWNCKYWLPEEQYEKLWPYLKGVKWSDD